MNRYLLRKCCFCLSLQTGTQIIGALSMFGGLVGLGLGIFLEISTSYPKAVNVNAREMMWYSSSNQIFVSIVFIVVTVYLLVSAIKNGNPMFLVPWLVMKSVSLFALIFNSIYLGIIFVMVGYNVEAIFLAIGLFIGTVATVISSYFWWVVYSYYHQLATVGTKMEAYQCSEKC